MASRAPLCLISNCAGNELAHNITKLIAKKSKDKVPLLQPKVVDFAVGEFKIVLPTSVRGKDVFLIQCAVDQSNPKNIHRNIWETLQTIDTLRHCHAQNITVVMPCMPYARQDKRWGREPSTAMMLAEMIGSVGADAFITIDLHASQIKGYFEMAGVIPDALYATNIFIQHIRDNYTLEELVVVPTDAGAVKRALFYADKIFSRTGIENISSKVIFVTKKRSTVKANAIDFTRVEGNVKDKIVLIVDDMVDTAGTLRPIIEAIYAQGAKQIIVCATHAILSPPAANRLDDLYAEGKLHLLLTTDTIPHKQEFLIARPYIKRLSVAPMLAEMVRRINNNLATSDLYL